jgi:hypothetical protein
MVYWTGESRGKPAHGKSKQSGCQFQEENPLAPMLLLAQLEGTLKSHHDADLPGSLPSGGTLAPPPVPACRRPGPRRVDLRRLATIMHTLLDIGEVRLMPGIPQRVVEAMTRGEPIRGLI